MKEGKNRKDKNMYINKGKRTERKKGKSIESETLK